MNQILVTESSNFKNNKNNKNNKKTKMPNNNYYSSNGEMTKIVRFFAILILVFGLALCGNGTYAIIQEVQEAKNSTVPVVTAQRSGNAVTVLITCNTGIRTIMYAWNDSVETVVQGKNATELEQVVTVPVGNNKLNISVIDSKGTQSKFVKNFIQEEEDTTEPVITFEVVNSNIKIVVTDDTEIDYMTYKIGDNAEVTVNAEYEGQTVIEEIISVPQGQSTLTVEAVDKAENFATKNQEVKGVRKPIIEVIPDPNDPSYLIIKATDEEALRMVSYYINDQEYKTDPNTSLDTKTFEWRQKVEPGETKVTVHAYNVSEQVTEFIGIYNY